MMEEGTSPDLRHIGEDDPIITTQIVSNGGYTGNNQLFLPIAFVQISFRKTVN